MVEQVKTRTITERKIVYVAQDGTEFSEKEQCEKYERSAEAACRSRLSFKKVERPACDKNLNEWDKLHLHLYKMYQLMEYIKCNGNDCEIFIWKPKNEEEVKTFIQWRELVENSRPLRRDELSEAEKLNAPHICYEDELEAGKTYIIVADEGEYISVIQKEQFLSAMEDMLDTLIGAVEQ